jgi:RpiB/LacA/LacB family sugar-phosphate isomerase
MKIAIAADHAGFSLKERLREDLAREGHEVIDYGTNSADSVDYPDYAAAVGREVAAGRADRGILVCYTGVGMSIAANKVPGVRAALGTNPEEVRLTRAHNDANVLTLGAKFIEEPEAKTLADVFLTTEFEGGRHARRVAKIAGIEGNENEQGG